MKTAARNIIGQHALGDENDKEKVMEKLDKAEEEINKSGQSAISITDPEARFMMNKKERIELSYNQQITVDHDSGIILANDVTQDCTDYNQLQPQIVSRYFLRAVANLLLFRSFFIIISVLSTSSSIPVSTSMWHSSALSMTSTFKKSL